MQQIYKIFCRHGWDIDATDLEMKRDKKKRLLFQIHRQHRLRSSQDKSFCTRNSLLFGYFCSSPPISVISKSCLDRISKSLSLEGCNLQFQLRRLAGAIAILTQG